MHENVNKIQRYRNAPDIHLNTYINSVREDIDLSCNFKSE
jgi:hypothetical protein